MLRLFHSRGIYAIAICLFCMVLSSCDEQDLIRDLIGVRRWPGNTVNYRINSAGTPPGSGDAVKNSATTWNSVAESSFTFNFDGWTPSFPNQMDNINVVGWIYIDRIQVHGGWYYPLALTSPWIDGNNPQKLVECDTALSTRFSWSTNLTPDTYDVQNCVTHELGHWLELNDLSDNDYSECTMFLHIPINETKKRTLEDVDKYGIWYIYDSGNFPPPAAPSIYNYTSSVYATILEQNFPNPSNPETWIPIQSNRDY